MKIRTGFLSLNHLLEFVIIIFDTDLEAIEQTATSLAWLEDVFLYFEMLWGPTQHQWSDLDSSYVVKKSQRIFDWVVRLVLGCQEQWPKYATCLENSELRKGLWED